MTDTYTCPRFKSHGKSERRFQWDQASNGEWIARAYCLNCEPMELIDDIANPEQFADILPPKPPSIRPMI